MHTHRCIALGRTEATRTGPVDMSACLPFELAQIASHATLAQELNHMQSVPTECDANGMA